MKLIPTRIAAATALAMAYMGATHAQTTPAQVPATPASTPAGTAAGSAENAGDGLKLDTVIVTGTSARTTKMKSSVAVSTIEGDAIINSNATSSAELLRSIPGIRSESSGGESNANVGIRGLPISAGGARYVQFQEDGLPVLMFGDVAFATPDTWIRTDGTIDRLEVVRGGSASTLATGAPGGIINFVSKTGQEQGGFFGLTQGIGYQQSRQDFSYGGKMTDTTRFNIGGFYRTGNGGRDGAANTENGGQIRGNITKELDNGFIRLSFKHLDDHTPTFLPTPVRYVNGSIQEIPGLDPRRTAFYNAGWPADSTLTGSNGRALSKIGSGLSAKSNSVGGEVDLDLGNGLRFSDKFRWSKNSGRFIGIFPGDDVSAAPLGTTVASGANAGAAYAGNRFTAVVFNTSVDNAALVVNDAKLAKTFDLGTGGKITATGGLFTSVQDLALTWNFNQYSLSAAQSGAQLLNVPGTVNGSPGFGGCCMNYQDSKYRTVAPYAVLAYERGAMNLDASVRHDQNSAAGSYYQTIGPGGVAGTSYALNNPQVINYKFNKTSFSMGGNYRLQPNLALFARYSEGAAFLADRITFFNNPNLVNGRSPVIPTNEVKQLEGGVKWRAGNFSLFATVFAAKTDEVNVDLTSSPIKVARTKYDSKGVELEGAWRSGGFGINGGLTLTDANVVESTNTAIVGKTPKRQAKAVYQLTPTYRFSSAMIGASIVGTTSSKDDSPTGPVSVTLPAFVAVNAFANYQLTQQASIGLGVNNLFNTIGYTESNDGRAAARSITGRTARATFKYTF
jgi:catecholate siderophore receptor